MIRKLKEEKSPIILYGAGERAPFELNFLRETFGIEPVAFCDKNLNIQKQGFLGLPVFDPLEATQKYSDGYFYITVGKQLKAEIYKDLVEKYYVPRERILNCFEKYKSCQWLENALYFRNGTISYCCDLGFKIPQIEWRETIEDTMETFTFYREELIRDNQNPDKETPCRNCPDLIEAYWEIPRSIQVIGFNSDYPCHCRCIYCSHMVYREQYAKEIDDCLKDFHPAEYLKYLLENKMIDLKTTRIDIASGEIELAPVKDELLDFLYERNFECVTVRSNGIVYDEKITKIIKNKKSYLSISLDSGTKETYQKVKGVNAFERIAKNISLYRQSLGNVHLKYIFLEDNCGEEDIIGFINLCQKNHISAVTISCDIYFREDIPSKVLDGAKKMTEMAKKYHINIDFDRYFGEDALKELRQI